VKIPEQWRKQLFEQAQSLSLNGAMFQNHMDIPINDLVFELAEIDNARSEQMKKYDTYAASIRNIIRSENHGETS